MSGRLPEPDPEWLNEVRAMHGLDAVRDDAPKPPPDAADPEQIKARQRAARLKARELAATIAEMMSVREVRAVIYRWLNACRAFAPHDFPDGLPIDPLQLARNAAHRELAQVILADLHGAAPDQYLRMLREASEPQPGFEAT